MKHKHYDCIVAGASGEKIECFSKQYNKWIEVLQAPNWWDNREYRVKKESVVTVKYFELYTDCVAENGKNINAYYEITPDLEKWDLKITYHDDLSPTIAK